MSVTEALTLPLICEHLLSNNEFVIAMRSKLAQPISMNTNDFDRIIE